MAYSLLLFDLDGTLVDSQYDLATSVNHVRAMYGERPASLEDIRTYIGSGVKTLIDRALPGLEPRERVKALAAFREHYRAHCLDTTVTYPGVPEMLEKSSGRTRAVLTNKTEEFARLILRKLDIERHFPIIWGGDTGPRKKPDPHPIQEIVKRCREPRNATVMIGDGINDIMAAQAAGVASIAVGYGYTDRETLMALNPGFFAERPKDILSYV